MNIKCSKKILTTTVISAMVLFALLVVFTTSASAYCNSGSNDVLVTNPGGTSGGAYPYSSTTQSETTVTYTTINAALLANYDTFVMWRVCGGHLDTWTAQQKQDIVDWVYAGGKLIIWDTECTDNPDYSWLPYSFVTSNPGAMGARRCPLTVVEENTLSSSVTTSPYYIDTNTICQNTDAVGDANVLTTYSASLCKDMDAKNVLGTIGPVHVYAHYGSGLIIYDGLDADHITRSTSGGVNLRQILLNELAQPWGDEACGLPCGVHIPPGVLTVDKTGDKTTMNIGETVTFTITVKNEGTSTITGITLQDILPPELSTTDPTTWTIGTLTPGATATRTLSATAVTSGSAQNVAKAMGTDAAGNPIGSDDTFTVTITANQPPVADAGTDQTVEQTYYQGADVVLDGSGSYDPDGDPLTYSWTWTGGSATGVKPTVSLPLGTTTITLVVNDGTVDSAPDTVVITVQDTKPPVITCPADVTIEQETAAGTVVPLTATATDICDADPTITSDELAIYPLGTTTVTFTAKDDSGNSASCSMTVTVVDTTPPVITCPADVTVEQDTAAGTVVPLTATATDICDADPTITSDELAIYPLGTTTITFTATDDAGNSASCTTTVTVIDTTPPIITCPADVTVEQATAAGTIVPLTATATDICDASPTITSDELAIYPLGTTTVTFTATDDAGNSASCTTTVTVEDTTPPIITCPADVTVEQATAAGTIVPLTATATDICDASPTITSDELAIYPLGTTTVTFTATDDAGNSASCTTTVTVEDTTPPVITASGEQIVLWPPNHKYRTVEIPDCVISVTDICDADVDIDDIVITSVSSDEPEDAQGRGDGNTEDDIVIVDSQTVELRAERQGGGNGRVYTINFGVTDASGNTETGSCTVWVLHDQESDSTAIDDGADAGYTVNYP